MKNIRWSLVSNLTSPAQIKFCISYRQIDGSTANCFYTLNSSKMNACEIHVSPLQKRFLVLKCQSSKPVKWFFLQTCRPWFPCSNNSTLDTKDLKKIFIIYSELYLKVATESSRWKRFNKSFLKGISWKWYLSSLKNTIMLVFSKIVDSWAYYFTKNEDLNILPQLHENLYRTPSVALYAGTFKI